MPQQDALNQKLWCLQQLLRCFLLKALNMDLSPICVHNLEPCLSSHIMFTIAQVWNDSDEPDECLAMVVRTGLNAAVGKMMLSLFYRQRRWKGMRSPMGFLLKVLALAPPGPCPFVFNMRSKALSYSVS